MTEKRYFSCLLALTALKRRKLLPGDNLDRTLFCRGTSAHPTTLRLVTEYPTEFVMLFALMAPLTGWENLKLGLGATASVSFRARERHFVDKPNLVGYPPRLNPSVLAFCTEVGPKVFLGNVPADDC